MGRFDDLLAVQEHDSAMDRLRVQREKLPERDELAARTSELAALTDRIEELEAQRDDAARDEKRFDDQREALERKLQETEADLYSGKTSVPKELQALQAEIEQLRRQLSSLEDLELDVMERREGLDGDIGRLEEQRQGVEAEIARLESAIADQEQAIDAEIAQEQAGRDATTPSLAADLVELYEKIRVSNRGVGAARLVSGTCQACHLALPAVEVDRIKKLPADELVRCEQCSAILVR